MRQVRQVRYRAIADELRGELAGPDVQLGALLPSEADLASRFEASRVTVRKALEVLKDEGLVDSRQGFGWFVAGDTVRQSLHALATVDELLIGAGRRPEREVLAFGFAPPSELAARVLGPADVLAVRRRSLADGRPFDLVDVEIPGELGATVTRAQVESASFYDLLDVGVGRAEQAIGAAVVDDVDSALLEVPAGSPVLVLRRTTFDVDDRPLLVARHVFPAHLTEFQIELPPPGSGVLRSKMHLLSDSETPEIKVSPGNQRE